MFIYILLFFNLSFLYKLFNYRLSIIYISYKGFNIGNIDFFIDRYKCLRIVLIIRYKRGIFIIKLKKEYF
jgi:hypothetical protein